MCRTKGSNVYSKHELKEHKTEYMLTTPWFCIVCNRVYSLAGKWCHIKTRKHQKSIKRMNDCLEYLI